MSFLNLQTILFGFIFSNLICTIVSANLWSRNRKQYSGLGFWLVYFACNFFGIMFIALRGIIPDFLSMVVGSVLLVFGLWFLYIGINRFLGRSGMKPYHYGLLAGYFIGQLYFVYIHPSLVARNILFSSALVWFSGQIAWVLLVKVIRETKRITREVGYVAIAYGLVGILRIVVDLVVFPGNELLHSNAYEAFIFITFQMLHIVLTFSLFLMVNRRLHLDLEQDINDRKNAEIALQLSQERFAKAFQSSPDAILITRVNDGKCIEVNEGFCRMTGFTREETLGKTTLSLGVWVNVEERKKIVADIQANARIEAFIFDTRTKSGKLLKAELYGERIKIGDDDCMLTVIRDVSERKRVDDILNSRLRLWEFSTTHSAIEVMQTALDEIEALTGSTISFYHLVQEDQNTLTLQAWSTRTKAVFCKAESSGMHYSIDEAGVWVDCIRQKKPVIHNDYASLPHRKGMPEGHAQVTRELVVPIVEDGRLVSILGVGNKPEDYDEKDVELVEFISSLVWSIVSQKRSNEQIQQLNNQLEILAMTDELTGLANRRAFFLKGGDEITRFHRYHIPLSMIMLDLDRFKKINDVYGHEVGDLALQSIANTLKEHIREVDLPGRIGGEEFAILLPNTDLTEAAIITERLRKVIAEKTFAFDEKTITLTASFGVATCNPDMKKLDELFRVSDGAMYLAKNQGRNRVIIAEDIQANADWLQP